MTNPFENNDGAYLVLVNEEDQHSLWPDSLTVPAGWSVARAGDSREACLEYVERTWTDMRPKASRRP
ncbi:MbtH family protein [Streptomyces sp. NPDC002138]|uniref:MbtH family protein n=1 Tax=Streptomyces sp. NPDC002138 TaxID=3154410 RepID=UPI003327F377